MGEARRALALSYFERNDQHDNEQGADTNAYHRPESPVV
jgi:hypothetical protein